MRSGPSFLDLAECAEWIAEHLKDKSPSLKEQEVLAILHMETSFLRLVCLTEGASPDSAESDHIYRRGCWVLDPGAEIEEDQEIEAQEEEVKGK